MTTHSHLMELAQGHLGDEGDVGHAPPRETGPGLDSPAWRNQLLRVPEAADYLAVSRSKVYALMKAGELPSLIVGGSRRLTVGTVVDYVDRLTGAEG